MIAGAISAPSVSFASGLILFGEASESQELIKGIVKERSEAVLIVIDAHDETKETRFELGKNTKYFKDGQEVKIDQVIVGSFIEVKARRGSDGNYEASEVTVIRAVLG
jgi:uncharacterized protein (DUF952 family)